MIFWRSNTRANRVRLPYCALCRCRMPDGSERLLNYSPSQAGWRDEMVTKGWIDSATGEVFDEEEPVLFKTARRDLRVKWRSPASVFRKKRA